MKIGFIGLGIMGRPMALNLLTGGHKLIVWARRADSLQPLLEPAPWAQAARPSARGTELVITDGGRCARRRRGHWATASRRARRPGLVAVDMSTIAPAAARRIGSDARRSRRRFHRCPGLRRRGRRHRRHVVDHGRRHEAAFASAKPAFELHGQEHRPRRRLRRRPGGQGGQPDRHRHGRAGGRRGLRIRARKTASTAARCARRCSAASPIRRSSRTTASACSTATSSRASRAGCTRRTCNIVMQTAHELGLCLPGSAATAQMFNAMVGSGMGEEDSIAVLKLLERLSGQE